MIETIASIASQIFVGFVAAYFGFIFAKRKYLSEKIFDIRLHALSEIMSHIERAGHWFSKVEFEFQVDAHNAFNNDAVHQWSSMGQSEIRSAVEKMTQARLVIPDTIVQIVTVLDSELWLSPNDQIDDQAKRATELIPKTLEKIVENSRTLLSVPRAKTK
jgi:hypothetical protein